MTIFTIGFTKKSARTFFDLVRSSGAHTLVDVRLHNVSQLAGFAKRDDLAFFLKEICDVSYRHEPLLAPTADLLDDYKKRRLEWSDYEVAFLALMRERSVTSTVHREAVDGTILLCSEDKPHRCHRRLVAELLSVHWGGVAINHLGI